MEGITKVNYFDVKTLMYRGTYDITEGYQLGDLCTKDNELYVYAGGDWECITSGFCEFNTQITYPTNCKNCGAVLHSYICEYCGTDNKK